MLRLACATAEVSTARSFATDPSPAGLQPTANAAAEMNVMASSLRFIRFLRFITDTFRSV
jgi:hypothetical protein